MFTLTMSMGAYDEDEHERREQQASKVDTDFDDERTIYHGKSSTTPETPLKR